LFCSGKTIKKETETSLLTLINEKLAKVKDFTHADKVIDQVCSNIDQIFLQFSSQNLNNIFIIRAKEAYKIVKFDQTEHPFTLDWSLAKSSFDKLEIEFKLRYTFMLIN
jgi:hypothetical protein